MEWASILLCCGLTINWLWIYIGTKYFVVWSGEIIVQFVDTFCRHSVQNYVMFIWSYSVLCMYCNTSSLRYPGILKYWKEWPACFECTVCNVSVYYCPCCCNHCTYLWGLKLTLILHKYNNTTTNRKSTRDSDTVTTVSPCHCNCITQLWHHNSSWLDNHWRCAT